jgi:hypothetical protein
MTLIIFAAMVYVASGQFLRLHLIEWAFLPVPASRSVCPLIGLGTSGDSIDGTGNAAG